VEHSIKYFGLNNIALENDLRRVSRDKKIQLRPSRTKSTRDAYYSQISERIRHDAAVMAQHYELFYSLEVSIRDVIRARLEEKDKEAGVTPRSDDWLSYTNFGELGQIITANWAIFSDMFTDQKAVQATIARLNTLRGPIAHCSMLAEDEVVRLRLSLRDWFRLME
jgi:hypothetical protein